MRTMEEVIHRLRAEYLEMPGLRLKPAQVQRLCGVEGTVCQLVLDSLIGTKFLSVNSDGVYRRLTDGPHVPRRQAPEGISRVP
jgi:hypothetical protein